MSRYKSLIGIDPDQVPLNQSLGTLAYQDHNHPLVGKLSVKAQVMNSFIKNTIQNTGDVYLASNVSERGLVLTPQYHMNHLPFSITGVLAATHYNWLRATVALRTNQQYEFEASFKLQRLNGGGSRTISLLFNAPIGTEISYFADSTSTNGLTDIGAVSRVYFNETLTTTTSGTRTITAANSSSTEFNIVYIKGTLKVGANNGTPFAPLFKFSADGGDVNVLAHSKLTLLPLGVADANNRVSYGNWTIL